jgi:hypothetical protein
MRIVVGLIAAVSLASSAHASAPEQEPQSSTAPQLAQDSSPAQAAPASPPDLQPGVKATVPKEESPAPAPASPTSPAAKTDKPPLTEAGKQLLIHGYKLEVRNGENYFCRKEPVLGSRLRENKVCGTEETLARRHEIDQTNVRDSFQPRGNQRPDGH